MTDKLKKPRSKWRTQTLFKRALNANNDDTQWRWIQQLHLRGTLEVFEQAKILCYSRKTRDRRIGADVLGQIGAPERAFPEEVLTLLEEMLSREENPDVLNSILIAIGHTQNSTDGRLINKIIRFRRHKSAKVRFAVVFALLRHTDQRSIATLIELTHDKDSEVRDWATFGLGTQIDTDSLRIRRALWERVTDKHWDTKCEAIAGLAIRKDEKIKEVLIRELKKEAPTSLIFKAAADYGDSDLLPLMEAHIRAVKVTRGIEPGWLSDLNKAIEKLSQNKETEKWGRVENWFSLLPGIKPQRSSPAPPHQTVHEVLPHTAFRCFSSADIRGIFGLRMVPLN
jgi:hypothetical protein